MAQTHWTSPLFEFSPLSSQICFFFYFSPLKGMEDFCQKFLMCCLGSLFSHSESLFFLSSVSWDICMNKEWCIQQYGIISWDSLDVFNSFSTACSSKQPVPPIQPAPSASCPIAPPHQLKHPCWSSDGAVTMCIAACLFFPAPLHPETLQYASCPSCLKASFSLLSSAGATKPLLSPKVAGCPLHPLCTVQKAAGRGRSIPGARWGPSCPYCGAGGQTGQK